MAALAAVCGILIALFGLVATGRTPSEAQLSIEVTAFVGGLVLCFLAVVLARLKRLDRRIEGAASQLAAASPLVRPGAAEPPSRLAGDGGPTPVGSDEEASADEVSPS